MTKNSGVIYLFACHGATIAPALANATGHRVVATPQGVSFTEGGFAREGNWSLLGALINGNSRGWFLFSPDGTSSEYPYTIWYSAK